MSPPVIVRARGLDLTYPGGAEALLGVDLEVRRGELLAIVGPSGCGKSTLLRAIAGLQAPTRGTLAVEVPQGAAPIAFVFQDPTLLPWRRVVDNVALPLELAGRAAAPRRADALAALTQVGLADAAARYPDELSGGMKMRASLARAIVTAPALLLLDEPFGALDERSRRALGEVLVDLWREAGFTAILVTHSLLEAVTVASRVVVMRRRPGSIVDAVDVEIERPRGLERGHGAALLELVARLERSLAAGEVAGEAVGEAVGEAAGEAVGEVAGEAVGEAVGEAAGEAVGEAAGEAVGEVAGEAVGEVAGEAVGEAAGGPA